MFRTIVHRTRVRGEKDEMRERDNELAGENVGKKGDFSLGRFLLY